MLPYPFDKHFKLFLNSINNTLGNDLFFLADINKMFKFVLDKEYNDFLKEHFPLIDFFPGQRDKLVKSVKLIEEFDKKFNINVFFNKYNHLETLLKTKINLRQQFIDSVLEHLHQDKKLLSRELNIENFTIKSIQCGMGDIHQKGKSTTLITFENNIKVIYKPRSSGLDMAFNNLINEFNAFEGHPQLRNIKFIDCQDYCWSEFITHKPCNSSIELNSYYTKAGVLIAFMYFLRGTDIHFENIIAHGSNPILIDLECLFSNTNIDNFNILQSGLVPFLSVVDSEQEMIDLSGLGAAGEIKMGKKFWKWKNQNTDALNLEKDHGFFKAIGNQPVYKNKLVSPEKYIQNIEQGFELVSNWIFAIQPYLNDDKKNPFLQFKNQVFRIIPRLTQEYNDIIENSFVSNALQSKLDRKKLIETNLSEFSLHIPFVNSEQKGKIMKHELNAIERLDVPYFSGNTSELYMKESQNIVLIDYFKKRPYDVIVDNIKKFNQVEAENQKKYLHSALETRYNLEFNEPIFNKLKIKKNKKSLENVILDEIRNIADNLYKNITTNDNGISWYCFNEENDKVVFNLIDNSLYSGKIGIAIFLAQVSNHLKIKKYNKTVNYILKAEIKNTLKEPKSIDISFCKGISGLIHALLKIDPIKYKETAVQLSENITINEINNDKTFDIIGGSAGCLITLCELYEVSKSEIVLKKCILLGDYLLNNRLIDKKSMKKCWNSITGNPLTGFSHGASGIGLSLIKLYKISGIDKYKKAFYEALEYENYYYNDENKNWLDLRYNEEKYHNSWCHGASGIGLARISAYEIVNDDNLLTDINNAIEATKNLPLLNSDYYCCGNIGRIDFLMEASEFLKDIKLKEVTKNLIKSLIDKKLSVGYYQTFQNPNISVENSSLYKGTSGIGYVLLKYYLQI